MAAFRFPWVAVEAYDDNWATSMRQPQTRTDGFATYIHATDVARGYALALENPRPDFETYHFSATEISSRRQIAASFIGW